MNEFEISQIVLGAIANKKVLWFPGGSGHIAATRLVIPTSRYDPQMERWEAALARFERAIYDVRETSVFCIETMNGRVYFDPSALAFIEVSG